LTVIESKPWIWLGPGLMITLSVLAINFIGDGLRDALDPRMTLD
jgi:peptide/nickel transport system permease protein